MASSIQLDFLRHGQTHFNLYKKIQGWSNSPLTEEGIKGIKNKASEFSQVSYDEIYSSDLQRARDTAEIFLKMNEVSNISEIKIYKGFRELSFGSFEGSFGPQIWHQADANVRIKYDLSDSKEVPFPMRVDMLHELDPFCHAENYQQFSQRVSDAVEKVIGYISKQNESARVLIASHGSAIHNIFKIFDQDFSEDYEPKNSSISRLEYIDNKFKTVFYNHC